jgi:WD40 repeat protein
MTSVVNIPGRDFEVFAVGNDRKIWKREHGNTAQSGKAMTPYDCGVTLSQIVLTSNQKALIGGVGEEGKPGAIHVYKLSMEKVMEVQAHSKPIERIRLSYDNNWLFTCGQDGCLFLHDVKDRDPRGGLKRDRDGLGLAFSEEILTDKADIDGYITEKEQS